ncbi:MAG TPA: sigma-54 dependent transcriptional regulator [Polyangiaceae bacterium]|nr:sigma-54 dependent transcriptional regulator [Polyangiaceae bacterium]
MAPQQKSPLREIVPPELEPGDDIADDEDDGPTRIRQQFISEPTTFGNLVGRSAPMRSLFELLQRASVSEATVLLEGETGTGKEATAEAIHREGNRRNGPFVVIDCGAIPGQLLESELFGHERGAFTGAIASREGAFQAAAGGTIFLDEIGELTLDLQPKILRALERRQAKPVGATQYEQFDARVIAATNRSLRAEVQAQRFRSDLYYRLAVVQVKLPPLRERLSDLPLLVENMLRNLGVHELPIAEQLRSQRFLDRAMHYRWPGNVRQLRNYIERCVALGDPNLPTNLDTMPPPPSGAPLEGIDAIDISQPLKFARERCVGNFERRYLEALLRKHNDNVSAAARAAGVDRIHFYRLLWKHGLRDHNAEKPGEGGEK